MLEDPGLGPLQRLVLEKCKMRLRMTRDVTAALMTDAVA